MPKYFIRFLDGASENFEADKMAASTERTLPPFYDFYVNGALVRRIFVHALREEPRALAPDELPPGWVEIPRATGGPQ